MEACYVRLCLSSSQFGRFLWVNGIDTVSYSYHGHLFASLDYFTTSIPVRNSYCTCYHPSLPTHVSPWLFLCRRGLAPGVGQGPVPVIDSLYTYIPRARDANLIPIFDWLPFISGDSTRPHVYPYGSRKYTNRYIARRSLSRIYVLPLPLGLGAPRALWFRVVVRSRSGVVWPLWCAHRMTAGERSCRSGTGMDGSRFPGHTQHVGGGLRWAWCVRRCQRRCSWPRRDVLTFLFRELAYYVRFSREVLCQPSDPRSSDVGWMRTRRGGTRRAREPRVFHFVHPDAWCIVVWPSPDALDAFETARGTRTSTHAREVWTSRTPITIGSPV